ncbi:hypothetical protein N5C39_25110 [Enterobacter bugandensis]|uniref:Uncharacterized protein n=1 Tax=Enterobacter bugandensis TaxID=881260 RepID=A0AA42PVM7_9ENTR|nr:hypothetical protein [Enterobacter bugandensis]MDH1321619.1 hypothetical protein [Enterobacter bugandensis]
MDSHRDLSGERALFIANEIGAAVIELIANGMDVNRPDITDHLELKRKTVGNTLYKGVLRDASAVVWEKQGASYE